MAQPTTHDSYLWIKKLLQCWWWCCDSWCIAVVCLAIVGVPPALKIFTSLLLKDRQREREGERERECAKVVSLISQYVDKNARYCRPAMLQVAVWRLQCQGESHCGFRGLENQGGCTRCLAGDFLISQFQVPSVGETGWTTVITSQTWKMLTANLDTGVHSSTCWTRN